MIEDLTPHLLKSMPLPDPRGGDKDARGRVLVVGGDAQVPGAPMLTGIAALRAGAGKLQIACDPSVAIPLGVATPEARVFAWTESAVVEALGRCDAAVLGPGMLDEAAAQALAAAMLGAPGAQPLLLDAAALGGAAACGRPLVMTPHAGEMAKLARADKASVEADPVGFAVRAARRYGAVVALKGNVTHIAAPDGRILRHAGGAIGLATSGSGDVLAGIVGGLLARGADPVAATAWGVAVHARAGHALSRRVGEVGFLARELLDEIPALLA